MSKNGYRSVSLSDELYDWLEALAQKKHRDNPIGKVPSVPDVIKYLKEEHQKSLVHHE